MFILMVLALAAAYDSHTTVEEIEQEINSKVLYFGSTVRLEHGSSEFFLHSHLVSYGSGSGQQSVTGMRTDHDYNSLWTFKECHQQPLRKYDQEIKCGDCIRLEHMMTGKNLHSHQFQAPFSGHQEVSAYGDDGNGDGGDDWLLECDRVVNDGSIVFKADNWFYLKHKTTNRYLRTHRSQVFNQRTCGHHCPIEGQLEVSAGLEKNADTRWKVYAGLFFVKPQRDSSDEYQQYGSNCNAYGTCDDIEEADDEFETVKYSDL